jgi:dihydrofolate synthase/folylpolyglutamate synthase
LESSLLTKLLELLGNPEKDLRFIQVAGTNGKGSISKMLSSVLLENGYKTGLYTSPFILDFNERIAVDGEMISNDSLAEITSYVKSFAEKMDSSPTEFELITAIGFEYFKREKCDIVVLEAGMGGRFDATNAVENTVLSIITGISLDHTDYLGDTVEKIAWEKAGIIKPNSAVLFGGGDEGVTSVIKKEAKEKSARLYVSDKKNIYVTSSSLSGSVFSYKDRKEVSVSLIGSYQPENAAVVLDATDILKELGFNLSEERLRTALSKASWRARMEILSEKPLVIYDGGHNPEGICASTNSIKNLFGGKVFVVMGIMRDKDYHFIIKKISEIAEKVYCVTPDNPRSLKAEALAEEFRKSGFENAVSFESIKDAMISAFKDAFDKNTPIFAAGSLYMYKEVYENVKEMQK